MSAGLTLDAGALIAVERGNGRIRALLRAAAERSLPVVVPAGVVAQVWRGGPRQARLATLLASADVSVVELDGPAARAVGVLCGRVGQSDVVDGHVALVARQRRHIVVTSDPADIAAFDPSLPIAVV
ncbi:PIN domain-containing protein [Nocardioides massiliensis]|uniref:Nucleic acid-binding protein n=1 Tax=Nocardioides massiliensis TaxID=1325935 RepID=A0ABT9NSJ5_9ACTN|nr:PIN domain-containing protein [Nocardioides massiliensis]MDP9823389.1 putative nucleic acid-binding protein [Nocardioides massiliensis]